ncbi:MAG: hypothetical protein JWQ89_3188, partial [Devosia sp.]|uniref:hypothetical protein n=1 Tax=Devosia sp. TaxID=1871048 RepID=UPI00262542B2
SAVAKEGFVLVPREPTEEMLQVADGWGPTGRIAAAYRAMVAAGRVEVAPVAYVPIHPRTGPLWANTIEAERKDTGDSPSYARMALYAAPSVAPVAELVEALRGLVSVVEAAGVGPLSNGVQLGQTAWYVKCSDALELARAVLAAVKEASHE